jgi:putative membrane protein
MKIASQISALAGLLLVIGLIAYQGVGEVTAAILSIGWGIAAVGMFHAIPMLGSAMAWRAIARPDWHGTVGEFLWARWVREAVNGLLPLTQIGGDVVGARLLTFRGASTAGAMAGVLVDMTLELLTQVVFTAMGLALLVANGGNAELLDWIGAGLAIMIPTVTVFVIAQRRGLFLLLDRFVAWLAKRLGWPGLASAANINGIVLALYRDPRAVLSACAWHLLSWIAGVGEVWLALKFMGSPAGLYEAFVIESLSQAVRTLVFIVPGALGVQEGGFIIVGAMFGIGPDTALAVSLAKRVRELVFGLTALQAWQLVEARRLAGAVPASDNDPKRP